MSEETEWCHQHGFLSFDAQKKTPNKKLQWPADRQWKHQQQEMHAPKVKSKDEVHMIDTAFAVTAAPSPSTGCRRASATSSAAAGCMEGQWDKPYTATMDYRAEAVIAGEAA